MWFLPSGKSLLLLLLILGSSIGLVRGQEQWEKEGEGEIKDIQIEIVKDRKIVLPKANRTFEKVAPRPFEPIKPAITYQFSNFKFVTPDYRPVVRPLKLKQEDLSRLYGNYVSIGAGNYGSAFLEGSMTTKRDKNKFMGVHLYSRSFGSGPVDGKNSASSDAQLQVFGKSMGKSVTFSADAGVEYRGAYFYGYAPGLDVNRDLLRQTYTQYDVRAVAQNTQPGSFNYSLTGAYSYLQDHYRTSEGEVSMLLNSSYKLDDKRKILLEAELFLIGRKDSLISNSDRQLLRIRPSYRFEPVEKLTVTAGANIAVQSDQYAGSKMVHFYPTVKAQYDLGSFVEVYGLITGDVDKVDLHSLSAENRWIDSNIPITNTNRALEFKGGLTGKLGRKVSIGAGISVASLKNFYYYLTVRDNLNPGGAPAGIVFDKFNVVYDRNTKRINPFVEISYGHAEAFSLLIRGDYFSYDTDILLDAWHRPTYRFNASARYNLYEKITLEAGIIAQGGMKSLDPGTNNIISLDPGADVSFKARYFFSGQFSLFLQGNNILSNKYPLYQSYATRGFTGLAGISWSF